MIEEKPNRLALHIRQYGVIHLLWLVFILASIIIALASVKLGTDGSVKDILNFAVALSSLLLALVAIVQAIVSNGAMGDTIAEVHRAVASVSSPAERIENAARILEEHSTRVQDSSSEIRASIVALRDGGLKAEQAASSVQKDTFNPSMLVGVPAATKLGYYIFLRSFETKIPYRDLIPVENPDSEEINFYIRGMMSCLSAGGVIGTEERDDKLVVNDLGEIAWLIEKRADLLVASDADIQPALMRMTAQVEELAAQNSKK